MFASDRRGVGYYHLYTINADGSGILQLTSGAAHDRKLQISPDGARIAFVREVTGRQQDAFVIASDGSSFVQLTSDGRAKNRLEWSPDGTKLDVEVPSEGKNYGGIYVITTDGSSTTRIVADDASTLVGDPT